jgi:hypothetical protein
MILKLLKRSIPLIKEIKTQPFKGTESPAMKGKFERVSVQKDNR